MIDQFFSSAGWRLDRSTSPRNLGGTASEIEVWDDPGGLLTIARLGDCASGSYRLRFSNQLTVDVSPSKRVVIEVAASPEISESTRSHFLADQVLPRIISHDGTLVVHAGAVRHNHGCMVFIGESGFGKSSLTASFDHAGYPLMGDDALVISREGHVFHAMAVYPSLRLFPDSVGAVLSGSATTRTVAPYTSKLRVDVALAPDNLRAHPAPIEAIFVLGGPGKGKIEVRPITPASSCMAFIRNSFALDPSDTQCARKRLEIASQLSATIPAYEISYPHDYDQLPQVREEILAAVQASSRK